MGNCMFTGFGSAAAAAAPEVSTVKIVTFDDVPSLAAPYRVSLDQYRGLWRRHESSAADVAAPYGGGGGGLGSGVWKVKLAITPATLMEILAQEAWTEALIDSVRTVAKCGGGVASSSSTLSSVAAASSSDQMSVAGSRKAGSDFCMD